MLKGIDIGAELEKMRLSTAAKMAVKAEVFGNEVADDMKNNRPWTDRTGNARRSIHSEVSVGRDKIRVASGIGVFYGKYLELSNGGKYRVVRPTVDQNRRNFMQAFKGTLSK